MIDALTAMESQRKLNKFPAWNEMEEIHTICVFRKMRWRVRKAGIHRTYSVSQGVCEVSRWGTSKGCANQAVAGDEL